LQTAAANRAAVPRLLRRTAPARRGERRTKSVRVAIVLALFVALLAAALRDPVLRTAFAARDGQPIGEVVYSLPDGSFCRRVSFDNETAALSEGAVEPCPANLPKVGERGDWNSAWRAH
jgi:hypothetical protein